MKQLFLIMFSLICLNATAWEKTLIRTSTGAFTPKDYSVIRTNANTGNIALGNYMDATVSPQVMKINIIKTDDAGNVIWNKKINFSGTTRCMASAITNYNQNQYAIAGVVETAPGTGSYRFRPIVIIIDENGSVVNRYVIDRNGVGLTIKSHNGNLLVGGYYSDVLDNHVCNARQAFLCKFDNVLNLVWSYNFSGNVTPGYEHYEHVESIVPISTALGTYYFITGGITEHETLSGGAGFKKHPNILSQLVDDNGNQVWQTSNYRGMTGTDAVYNSDDETILLVANDKSGGGFPSNYFKIDFSTGAWTKWVSYEGDVNFIPHTFHIPYTCKINLLDDHTVKIYGYVRDYIYNGGTINSMKYIPFELTTDVDFSTPSIRLLMSSTFNYAVGGNLTGNLPSSNGMPFITPNMAVDYVDNGQQYYTIIGYDKYSASSDFGIHLYGSSNSNDCDRFREVGLVYYEFEPLSWSPYSIGDNELPSVIFLSNTSVNVTFISNCNPWIDGNTVDRTIQSDVYKSANLNELSTVAPIDFNTSIGAVNSTNVATVVFNQELSVLTIDMKDFQIGNQFEILISDISGKSVLQYNGNDDVSTLDLTEFANGLYIVNILYGQNVQCQKIVITH